MKEKIKETDIGKAVVAHFSDIGFDVYQEVQIFAGDIRADVIAVSPKGILNVIECKVSYGLDVIAQAMEWHRAGAHRVFVAVPRAKASKGRWLAYDLCRHVGVGVLEYGNDGSMEERVAPKTIRSAPILTDRLRNRLTPEHKTYAEAGNAASRYWTPFKATCREVLHIATASPGISLKELVAKASHHYSSDSTARSCISNWGQAGKIPGVEFRREGRRVTAWPAEVAK